MSTLFPHPVLHDKTLDYRDPKAYEATFQRKTKTILEVRHTLKRNTLVASLIEREEASFYCTVSVGGTAYRRTETIAANIREDRITATQEIKIPAFRDRPEVFVMAGVLNQDAKPVSWEEAIDMDDFHKSESSVTLGFPGHAMLACSGWRRFYPMDALFRTKLDSQIDEGIFQAETCYQPTIRITITMGRKLFREVNDYPRGAARAHVLCASLIPALKELEERYRRCSGGNGADADDIDQTVLEAAEGLKQYLISKKIPTWEDEEFNAVEAASKFKPAMPDDYGMED